jgi:hypothetical protein
MNTDPVKGIKSDTFNEIQFYKEQLGIKTRINPKVLEETTIHKEKIEEALLDQINMVREYTRE